MTFQNAVDEIREFNASYNLVEEQVLSKGITAHLINQKRARVLNEHYHRHGQINPQWVQNMGVVDTSRVDFSDELDSADIATSGSKCEIARFEIPSLVSIDSDRNRLNDIGLRIVRSTTGEKYDPTTREKFLSWRSTGDPRGKENVYWREGLAVYIFPYRAQVNLYLILEDPRKGYIVEPGNVPAAGLVIAENYTVESGNISYNTGGGIVKLQEGDTFQANVTGGVSWTGDGIVRLTTKRRVYRMSDPYPIDGSLWHHIKNLIIDDLRQGKAFIGDTVHDGADEESLRESRQ